MTTEWQRRALSIVEEGGENQQLPSIDTKSEHFPFLVPSTHNSMELVKHLGDNPSS